MSCLAPRPFIIVFFEVMPFDELFSQTRDNFAANDGDCCDAYYTHEITTIDGSFVREH